MMRIIFSAIAFLTCAILIPINVSYNLKNVPSSSRDSLSMLTIRNVSGNILWAHVGMVYVITAVVIIVVYMHWTAMVRLRSQFFRSPEYTLSFYARTLIVMRVPKKFQSDEGIRAIFDSVQVPYPTTAVHVGRRVGDLPHLIEIHNNTVREFEQVLVRYLNGGKIGKTRPTIRLGGFLKMGGQKVDAIDYYTSVVYNYFMPLVTYHTVNSERLKRTEQAVEAYRAQIVVRKAENYGFASMAAIPYAHIVAQLLESKRPKGSEISLAPNPKDIVSKVLSAPLCGAHMFCIDLGELEHVPCRTNPQEDDWLVPARSSCLREHRPAPSAFLSCQLVFRAYPPCLLPDYPLITFPVKIASFVPFLHNWSHSSPASFNLISGVLPPAVSAIFSFFLPILMRHLSQYQGALTESRLDRAVVARYFAFLVIAQLIIFTLIGVVFSA
jgi:calcium permeable stress-gated cation channel